jgi:uncharacterized C2H2 Zn-finger protein
MRESRTIHINVADLVAMRQGHPLLIEGADGHPLLRIEWDGAIRRSPVLTSETTTDVKDAPKPVKCPYCDKILRSVKAHIYYKHPGKSLDPTGSKCRYCSKRFNNDVSVMRHEVRSHPKAFRSRRTGKPSPKLQAKEKEVSHA